ncbi:hypothetical protein IQ250_16385 [Pseudanabaenaceae cyanobacterium LEGE 13415]|nr:hypothetical protein [Pseudanabaenaceae cyanobacterium LEGE 13415]
MNYFGQCKAIAAKIGLSIVGVTAFAVPAFADNPSVSGAVSYTTPAGYATSISAEKVAPAGFAFNGAATVTIVPGTGGAPLGLSLDTGTLSAVGTPPSTSTIKGTVVQTLGGLNVMTKEGLDAYAAILKAAAGANGLE